MTHMWTALIRVTLHCRISVQMTRLSAPVADFSGPASSGVCDPPYPRAFVTRNAIGTCLAAAGVSVCHALR